MSLTNLYRHVNTGLPINLSAFHPHKCALYQMMTLIQSVMINIILLIQERKLRKEEGNDHKHANNIYNISDPQNHHWIL